MDNNSTQGKPGTPGPAGNVRARRLRVLMRKWGWAFVKRFGEVAAAAAAAAIAAWLFR
jgi:hypothetical protein